MSTEHPLRKAINTIRRQFEKSQKTFDVVTALTNQGFISEAYEAAFDFAAECEKLTLSARSLPHFTGHPQAFDHISDAILNIVPVKIQITDEGWFKMSFPALLPKKDRGSPEYIRGYLYPALQRYFKSHPRIRFPNSVVIVRHNYDRKRPERQYRDHDNIEVKAMVDLLAAFLLDGDAPMRCFHFYCSAPGDADGTEVIVLRQSDFHRWLSGEEFTENEKIQSHERPP